MRTTTTRTHPRRLGRSALAVLTGLVAIVVLSTVTDQFLHSLDVYPPWGEPMYDPGHNLLALAYRIVYSIFGCYIAARLAPYAPMRHALALGVVGVVLSTAGAIVMWEMALKWYSVALALVALPCAWLGGALHRMQAAEH